jgi:hypothetical protein
LKYLSSAPLSGRVLAFLTNSRLGWRGLPGTNTNSLRKFVTSGCKKFYNIGPRPEQFYIIYNRRSVTLMGGIELLIKILSDPNPELQLLSTETVANLVPML